MIIGNGDLVICYTAVLFVHLGSRWVLYAARRLLTMVLELGLRTRVHQCVVGDLGNALACVNE